MTKIARLVFSLMVFWSVGLSAVNNAMGYISIGISTATAIAGCAYVSYKSKKLAFKNLKRSRDDINDLIKDSAFKTMDKIRANSNAEIMFSDYHDDVKNILFYRNEHIIKEGRSYIKKYMKELDKEYHEFYYNDHSTGIEKAIMAVSGTVIGIFCVYCLINQFWTK